MQTAPADDGRIDLVALRAASVNFLGADGPARIHETYPDGTRDRLVAIKRRYDPRNLFRSNQDIPPTGG